jgi:flavodoxin
VTKILIIYSTIGGNTQFVVDAVSKILTEKNFEIEVCRVDIANPTKILESDCTILASPTYNQGTLEDHFKPFLKNWKSVDTSDRNFAVIGLGNIKYYPEYLTESAGILEAEIAKKKGKLLISSLRIGGDPLKVINSLVPRWCEKLEIELKNLSL